MDPVWWEPVIIFAVVLLAFLAVGILLWAWENRFDPVGWGIVLSMGTYAIMRNRAVPYFVLAVLPLLALAVVRVVRHLPDEAAGRPPQWLQRIGVIACLLVLTASVVDQAFFTRRFPMGFGVAPAFFPEEAATFLERHHLDGRVFNSYKFGAYLMWRRWPANQVFIDGRYDAVLFDEALLEEYFRAHRDPAALDRIAAKYGVELLVLDADPERRIAYLTRPSSWARVYWDPVAEVFVRRNERHSAFIAAHEYCPDPLRRGFELSCRLPRRSRDLEPRAGGVTEGGPGQPTERVGVAGAGAGIRRRGRPGCRTAAGRSESRDRRAGRPSGHGEAARRAGGGIASTRKGRRGEGSGPARPSPRRRPASPQVDPRHRCRTARGLGGGSRSTHEACPTSGPERSAVTRRSRAPGGYRETSAREGRSMTRPIEVESSDGRPTGSRWGGSRITEGIPGTMPRLAPPRTGPRSHRRRETVRKECARAAATAGGRSGQVPSPTRRDSRPGS